MDLVRVRLPHHDQRALGLGRGPLFDPVVARDVPRVGPGEIGRLHPARFPVALVQYPVAVAAGDHLSAPRLERAVAVAQVRVALPQILVGQFEVEVVADTL